MDIGLIALDLDGTLVRSDGIISEANRRAIRRAVECGVKVVIASGRIVGDAASFRLIADMSAPVIACNGAVIANGDLGNPRFSRYLDVEKAVEVVEAVHSCGSACHLYSGNSVYIERANPSASWYKNRVGELPPGYRFELSFVDDLGRLLGKHPEIRPYKVMTVEYDPVRRAALDLALSRIGGIEVTGSHSTNREVLAPGVSKGSALTLIMESLGLSKDRVMAVGDNENDLPMLRASGRPVAMGNATESVKREAKTVTATNDEDGVALAISRVLERL